MRKAGVCNYHVAQLKESRKHIRFAINQVPYSTVKRDIEQKVVPYCIEHNKSIIACSPPEGRLLTGKMKPGYQFAEGGHRANLYFFKDENLRLTDAFLQKIKPLADDKGATLGQLVLRWTTMRIGIIIAVAGAHNAAQAK